MARAVPIAKQYHVLANISGQWKAGDSFNPTFACFSYAMTSVRR